MLGIAFVTETVSVEVPKWVAPLISDIQGFMSLTSWLVGGIFGLYLIYFIFQLRYWYKFNRMAEETNANVKEIKARLDKLETKLNEEKRRSQISEKMKNSKKH